MSRNHPSLPTPELPPEWPLLLTKVVDGRLTAEEAQRLRELLRDPRARDLYVDFLATHTLLRWHFGSPAQLPGDPGVPPGPRVAADPGRLGDEAAGAADAPESTTAPASPARGGQSPSLRRSVPSRRPWWLAAAAAVLLAAALAAVLVLRNRLGHDQVAKVPQPAAVATLTRAVNPTWDGPGVAAGTPVSAGQRLQLSRGVVELAFGNGAKVVVEGPAAFAADSPAAVSLDAGRLAATAPGAARGFAVRTPGATVTDLGTEFGVAVDPAGATEVQVFVGQVQAVPRVGGGGAARGGATTQPSLLKAGDAGRVTAAGVTVTPGAANPQAFVRSLSTPLTTLDLTDLAAGGDGTTHRRGRSIDLRAAAGSGTRPGDSYRSVPGLPAIDGLFIPNGTSRVDSAGQSFAFPATGGESEYVVQAGGKVPMKSHSVAEHYSERMTKMGGVEYGDPDHGSLFMNSNLGLTFDLAAIRRLHPGQSISRFRCVAGSSHPPGRDRLVDTFVLVDGAARFQHHWRGEGEAPAAVDVPLSEQDRFLTLAVTDGGDGINWDWIVWGDPVLDVAASGAGGTVQK